MGRRQNMRPQPFIKHMEAYNNFSGGLNTVVANDLLKNTESPNLINVDLGDRGSIKRRYGMKKIYENENIQGVFELVLPTRRFRIEACDGRLYNFGELLPINKLSSGFQKNTLIEGVQYQDKLFLATGTKLVQVWFDEDEVQLKASVVEAYKPQPLEALYIGLNGLAENPNDYLQNGVSQFLRLEGVAFSNPYGVVNGSMKITAFISKPENMNVEYKFWFRYFNNDEIKGWHSTTVDWTTENSYSWRTGKAAEMEWEVQARPVGSTNEDDIVSYHVPKFIIKDMGDVTPKKTTTHVNRCSKILLHWDRLIMYGDTQNPSLIYISHLRRPEYFPMSNTLSFDNDRNEGINKLLQFRDMVVSFSDTKIQGLFGRSPLDYRRIMINTKIGCIASETAKVVDNNIMFLSNEGVYSLKSVGFSEDRANVVQVDTSIKQSIHRDKNACAVVYNNQYHLVFPDKKERFRYYFDQNVWTKDYSEKFNLKQLFHTHVDFRNPMNRERPPYLQAVSNDGKIYQFDKNYHTDDGYVYECLFETKMFDFGEPYNPKKLKELQMLIKHHQVSTSFKVYVFADAALVVDPIEEYAEVNENGEIVWVVIDEDNLQTETGSMFGRWKIGASPLGDVESGVHKLRLTGKCRKTKVVISHKEDSPFQLLGLGYIFKTKKP